MTGTGPCALPRCPAPAVWHVHVLLPHSTADWNSCEHHAQMVDLTRCTLTPLEGAA